MVTVETTIRVSIPDEGMTLEQLEAAVGEVVRDAGQALLLAGCQAIETQALARAGSELRPDKRRAVDLLTRFGNKCAARDSARALADAGGRERTVLSAARCDPEAGARSARQSVEHGHGGGQTDPRQPRAARHRPVDQR